MQSSKQKEMGGIILNPYCDFDCLFCDGRGKASKEEIKKQEKKVYKNLEEFKNKGIKKISISGADPIEYEYLAELIAYIKKDFNFVKLSTHGAKLSDQNTCDNLIEAGLDQLRIPIYGSKGSIHDSVTGKPGSFKNTISGIKNILNKTDKIEFQINTLIVKNNKDNLLNIVDLINELGIKVHFFFYSQNSGW